MENNKLSRRKFVQTSAIASAGIPVVGGLLQACSSDHNEKQRKFGDLYFVLEQLPIDALLDEKGNPVRATPDEIVNDMKNKNFTNDGKYFFTKDYVVTDLEPRNVIKGTDGNLYYIDPVISLNTKDGEFGGSRTYEDMYDI